MQRWRKPITVAAVETDPEFIWVDGDGQEFDHYDLTFPSESWHRIREGRACLRCWEVQEIPLLTAPSDVARRTKERHLPGCVYAPGGIKENQLSDIRAEFRGTKWIGPKQKLEDTLAEDDERRAKYKKDTGNTAGIVVPPWVEL